MPVNDRPNEKLPMAAWENPLVMHNWLIEEREYERHESRRGRRHAFEHLDAARTALVVIDMIPFFVTENSYAQGIVPNIQSIANSLRSAGGTVAWVLPATVEPSETTVEFYGPDIAKLYSKSGGTGALPRRLWHEFEVAPGDILVEKSRASAFFPGHCDLASLLHDRDINTVLIAGTVANVCCESTARDARTLGYRVIMIADANAALRDQDLNATIHTIYRSFGDVRPTSDVIDMIEASTKRAAGD